MIEWIAGIFGREKPRKLDSTRNLTCQFEFSGSKGIIELFTDTCPECGRKIELKDVRVGWDTTGPEQSMHMLKALQRAYCFVYYVTVEVLGHGEYEHSLRFGIDWQFVSWSWMDEREMEEIQNSRCMTEEEVNAEFEKRKSND